MDLDRLLETDDALAAEAGRLRLDSDGPFPVLAAKIKLTWRCNLRCGICSTWRMGLARRDEVDPLDTATVIPLLERLAGLGLQKVHLSGGEVLLRSDLPEIIRRAVGLDLQVNLTTNGTLLDKDAARMLIEEKVHTVAISIDGASEKMHDRMRGVPGAWRLTWKGVERLRKRKGKKGRGPVIAVNTVVTRKNIDSLPELYGLLEERGVEKWRLLPVRTPDKRLRPTPEQWGRIAEVWEDWRPILDRGLSGWRSTRAARLAAKGKYASDAFTDGFCRAPWFNLFVNADGSIYSCCTGRWTMPSYGNILETGLDKILQSQYLREVRAGMATGHEYEVCRSCDEFLEENETFDRAAAAVVKGAPCPGQSTEGRK